MIERILKLVRPSALPAKPSMKRSNHWPAVRAAHLRVQSTCQACGGTDALEVHHIQTFATHPELELRPDNLLTLCEHPARNCHFVFGHGGFSWHDFNPHVVLDAAWWRHKLRAILGRPGAA
jgi:5-methylcytosine-specific restriction enzyme A